jgi:hypothetical protein
VQKEKEDAMRKMRWYAGSGQYIATAWGTGHYGTQLEDGTVIEVHPDVYQQHFESYLRHRGIEPTTYHEIFTRAEHEWNAFCKVRAAFDEDREQWREHDHLQGVIVVASPASLFSSATEKWLKENRRDNNNDQGKETV